uniref:NADH-ubiquinone oxidoreductase chain 2 n=1 Tax=Damithrax spinosissimus TaxID=765936 RepID=A0A0U1XGB8_DAMSP|nr:NADH dehydrogenase subunit 2 [Damithrax spinosissimus]AIT75861.1 NADH dehydrogenase subunit 2 [Damithrax spinosissimus]
MLISISSSSWFGAWLGLELNLLSFIPLISSKANSFLSEAALKYFLIQALGSATFIMASSLYLPLSDFSSFIILLALLLKLGASPFHFWFPQVMSGLFWPQSIILLTLQKIAPMILLSYIYFLPFNIKILTFSAIMSAIIGAVGGLNTLNLRKIMAFSSINHMSWMLIAFYINTTLWLLYFLFYSIISSSLILLFYIQKSYSFSNILTFFQPTIFFSFFSSFTLLSLGGLPPLSGFVPKWIVIQAMMQSNMFFTLFFLLSSALVTLFFYLRISIPLMMMTFPSLSFSLKQKKPSLFLLLFFLFLFNILGIFFPLWSFLI